MKIEFGKTWSKKMKNRIEGFNFEIGVLEDKPHRLPVFTSIYEPPKLGEYAGGPVRKATRENSGLTIGEVLIANMERMRLNLLWEPFQKKSSDIMKFTTAFLKMAVAKGSPKRVENLLQAVVRNPILKQEYGPNSASTADAKGFNRHLIDTGQTFKAIRAKVKRV